MNHERSPLPLLFLSSRGNRAKIGEPSRRHLPKLRLGDAAGEAVVNLLVSPFPEVVYRPKGV